MRRSLCDFEEVRQPDLHYGQRGKKFSNEQAMFISDSQGNNHSGFLVKRSC